VAKNLGGLDGSHNLEKKLKKNGRMSRGKNMDKGGHWRKTGNKEGRGANRSEKQNEGRHHMGKIQKRTKSRTGENPNLPKIVKAVPNPSRGGRRWEKEPRTVMNDWWVKKRKAGKRSPKKKKLY